MSSDYTYDEKALIALSYLGQILDQTKNHIDEELFDKIDENVLQEGLLLLATTFLSDLSTLTGTSPEELIQSRRETILKLKSEK